MSLRRFVHSKSQKRWPSLRSRLGKLFEKIRTVHCSFDFPKNNSFCRSLYVKLTHLQMTQFAPGMRLEAWIADNFFSVQRLLAFARSFNTFDCMLHRTGKLANWCIQIAAIGRWHKSELVWDLMQPSRFQTKTQPTTRKHPKQQNTQKHNQTKNKHQKHREESDRRSSSMTIDEKEVIALYQLKYWCGETKQNGKQRHKNHIAIPLCEFFFRPTPLGFRQVVPHVQLHVA